MPAPREPTFTIPAGCELGEGPVWDDRLNCLWWTDIPAARLWRWDWATRRARSFPLPERLGSLGLTSDPDWLVCAFASGFACFSPESGALDWIARTEPDYRGIRMNDGRVDAAGRFWAGSMVEDGALAGGATGTLYRLDPDGTVEAVLGGIAIANSICFTPDGSRLVFADSPSRMIRTFRIEAGGRLGDERVLAHLPAPAVPDGSETDAAGWLWNAEWGGARVTCYELGGAVSHAWALPVSQPTCVAFGGPALDHLFVTSARQGLSAGRLTDEPLAGDILVYKLAARGKPAGRFPIERCNGSRRHERQRSQPDCRQSHHADRRDARPGHRVG